MRVSRPLFRIDPGWLFIPAGLAMIAAAILIPPQIQLEGMQQNVEKMRSDERQAIALLRAYSDFTDSIDQADETLTRRLTAAHLKLIRQEETPILIASSASAPVTKWIEATVERQYVQPLTKHETRLSRLVTGPYRHWLLAGSAVCLFIGLLPAGKTDTKDSEGKSQED